MNLNPVAMDSTGMRTGGLAWLGAFLRVGTPVAFLLADIPIAAQPPPADPPVAVKAVVLDAATRQPLAARVYVQAGDGTWHFPESASPTGSSIRYERSRRGTVAVERHATVSAHPFRLELRPGRYTFTIERGKEYIPVTRNVDVVQPVNPVVFHLRRWADMAAAGWYSGDTHVHRQPAELANTMLAEDLNVALPTLDWTSATAVPPTASPKSLGHAVGPDLVSVDQTHVWYPRNTEFEIFRTGEVSHTLGAILILNHKTRFTEPLIPLGETVTKARREGSLIDLEKHNWPWSVAMVPLLEVDLFELANNHFWRTDYALSGWALAAPEWMGLAGTGTATERDWMMYGFETYYALLNCGFRLRPTAGTASGVHPVPLGYSRVYVQLDEPFNFEAWMRGLDAGRSFVTTGPMLFARADGRWPGATLPVAAPIRLHCRVRSELPLDTIELVENGTVVRRLEPTNRPESDGFTSEVAIVHQPMRSGWIAWRCFERRPGGRLRFAHTGPWHFTVPGKPLLPRREQINWLVACVENEIARSRPVAPPGLIADYERALAHYRSIANQVK